MRSPQPGDRGKRPARSPPLPFYFVGVFLKDERVLPDRHQPAFGTFQPRWQPCDWSATNARSLRAKRRAVPVQSVLSRVLDDTEAVSAFWIWPESRRDVSTCCNLLGPESATRPLVRRRRQWLAVCIHYVHRAQVQVAHPGFDLCPIPYHHPDQVIGTEKGLFCAGQLIPRQRPDS